MLYSQPYTITPSLTCVTPLRLRADSVVNDIPDELLQQIGAALLESFGNLQRVLVAAGSYDLCIYLFDGYDIEAKNAIDNDRACKKERQFQNLRASDGELGERPP